MEIFCNGRAPYELLRTFLASQLVFALYNIWKREEASSVCIGRHGAMIVSDLVLGSEICSFLLYFKERERHVGWQGLL